MNMVSSENFSPPDQDEEHRLESLLVSLNQALTDFAPLTRGESMALQLLSLLPEKVPPEFETLMKRKLTFDLRDLMMLSDESLLQLKAAIYNHVRLLIGQDPERDVTDNVLLALDPTSQTNVFQHELDHLLALPIQLQETQNNTFSLFLVEEEVDGYKVLRHVGGWVNCPSFSQLGAYESALIHVAPSTLGPDDVKKAKKAVAELEAQGKHQEAGNIKKVLESKPRHEFMEI
jgi:hypothetical protein